jgi:peroxiredoxin
MRPLAVAGLSALIAALAGCGSSSPPRAYSPEYLKGVEGQFHQDAPANRQVAADQMPLKFTDVDGKPVDLASFRGKSNVVLVMVKGMPTNSGGRFCPGCLAQVGSLAANYEEFKKRGAEVVMVFPGPSDKLPQFLSDGNVDGEGGNPKVPFTLALDPDLKAVDALGIRGQLARPSTYILDRQGNTVYAFVGETTTDRPSVKALFAQLDKLNAKPERLRE